MCEECGCGIDISLTKGNDDVAHEIWHSLKDKGVLCINIMGAPGSGKTTVIEHVAEGIGMEKVAVIQGDLESDIDKVRLSEKGVYTYQINTHSGCHLEAAMISKALEDMDFEGKEYLLIENVGNLVCPAGVKLGQHMDMVVSSTTEGSDKPLKYPIIFHDAKVIVVSKIDLSKAVDFDEAAYMKALNNMNPRAKIVKTSKKDVASFLPIIEEIRHQREDIREKRHSH